MRLRKYGGTYTGEVVRAMKTRLEVEFTTNGGKTKRVTVPAVEVERVGRVAYG